MTEEERKIEGALVEVVEELILKMPNAQDCESIILVALDDDGKSHLAATGFHSLDEVMSLLHIAVMQHHINSLEDSDPCH